jgi:hypothetical protein
MKNLSVIHKNPSVFFIVICLFVFTVTAQQNTDKTNREVKERILTSKSNPKIRLKFAKKFKFVGSQEFTLYERAKAEQYFFIESENKKIKRLFMLQFESFLPEITDGKYDYNEPNSIEIGGLKYFSNTENVPNVEMALKAVPDSDIAKAAKFLQDKGFILMKLLKYQRFVRVLDDAKRSEFIMLYVEDAEIPNNNGDLQSRALANFKVLK